MVPTKTDRARPTLIWALALVAISAMGLWASRGYMRAERARFEEMESLRMAPYLNLNLPDPDGEQAKISREIRDLQIVIERRGGITCFLAISALGVLAARFFTRQVSADQMLRQPGTSACVAFAAPIPLHLASLALFVLGRQVPLQSINWMNTVRDLNRTPGPTIFGVWLILFLSKSLVNRWDWIEVIGVAIGSYGVLNAVAPNWYTRNPELMFLT
jgi:hypothetical protein